MASLTPVSHKPRPFVDLVVSIFVPSFILIKLSGAQQIGASGALMLALAFPLGWGMFELVKYRKYNGVALLGIANVLLTGGIGLLKIDTQWLAIKEAAIPGIIGIAVLISARTRAPFVRLALVNPAILNIDRIFERLSEKNMLVHFDALLRRATYMLGGTFFFSSTMNYVLAKWIVSSPSGSVAFNEELGRLTLLSYPMIAVPSMVMLGALLVYLWRCVRDFTGLSLEEMLVSKGDREKK